MAVQDNRTSMSAVDTKIEVKVSKSCPSVQEECTANKPASMTTVIEAVAGATLLNTLVGGLLSRLEGVEDKRHRKRNFRYLLPDIIMGMAIAIMGGMRDIPGIHVFMANKVALLNSLGLFVNPEAKGGTPSASYLYEIMRKIDKKTFSEAFYSFVRDLLLASKAMGYKVVAVDGKRMRGTSCGENGVPLNIQTSLLVSSKLPLMATACDTKSNEIKAWDALLEAMGDKIKGVVYTADAMGCQREIVRKIKRNLSHYCLAVKGNQVNLNGDIQTMVAHSTPTSTFTEKNEGHGRIETRKVEVFKVFGENEDDSFIYDAKKWEGLARVVRVTSERTVKKPQRTKYGVDKEGYKKIVVGETVGTSHEVRYYISDLEESAETFCSIIRSEWSVEIFHWNLDTNFMQDKVVRNNDTLSNSSNNFDTLQKMAYVFLTLFDIEQQATNPQYVRVWLSRLMDHAQTSDDFIKKVMTMDLSIISVALNLHTTKIAA